MATRSRSFGAVAAAYERFRPGYPDELVDEVLRYAGRPVRRALEIGAGTGKASRAFAARGIVVTATDPDPAMLAELRRHVPDTVTTVEATLEDLPSHPVHDLVIAAASLHWTEPEGRWARVAGVLAPGGVVASFGGQRVLTDPQLRERVEAARSPYLEGDEVPSPDGTPADAPMQWPGTELLATPLFREVRQSTFRVRTVLTADHYVGHLSTVSAYLQLAGPARRAALEAVRDVVPDHVDVTEDVTLHLARRR